MFVLYVDIYQPSIFDGWFFIARKDVFMDCPNKNCKYYVKKEKDYRFCGFYMRGMGGYCTRGYCEVQQRKKKKVGVL